MPELHSRQHLLPASPVCPFLPPPFLLVFSPRSSPRPGLPTAVRLTGARVACPIQFLKEKIPGIKWTTGSNYCGILLLGTSNRSKGDTIWRLTRFTRTPGRRVSVHHTSSCDAFNQSFFKRKLWEAFAVGCNFFVVDLHYAWYTTFPSFQTLDTCTDVWWYHVYDAGRVHHCIAVRRRYCQ